MSFSQDLSGTSWQLVRFQGGDGTVLIPDDRAKYTIAFGADGRVAVRIDCNRGSGTWRSVQGSQIEFGPLALTKMMCPPGSLHDRIVRHWPYLRSYIIRNGHLFLSLMADGGIYEFEPMRGEGTSAGPGQGMGTGPIRGTAAYRERIALPSNAAFEATLEDVSRSGGGAEVIALVRNEQPGNPPIPFLIAFDRGRINPRHTYSVRGRIFVDGNLWFETDQSYPVLTAGRGSEVQLLLRRANTSGPGRPVPGTPSAAPLENTYWKLTNLGNAPVAMFQQQREPHFILQPATRAVTGSGGCNRLTGTYQLNSDRLSFNRVAATMMACVNGMETEQMFMKALGRVNRWRISGQRLELLDAAGTSLARFEAVYMR